MFMVERMEAGVFSFERRWLRWALGMRGEYIVRWRSVRSWMRSILDASGLVDGEDGVLSASPP